MLSFSMLLIQMYNLYLQAHKQKREKLIPDMNIVHFYTAAASYHYYSKTESSTASIKNLISNTVSMTALVQGGMKIPWICVFQHAINS